MPPPKHVPDSKFVDFEANDGTVVTVSASVAKEAKTLWDPISMLDDLGALEGPIKLENVNGNELKWVLEWCEFLKKRNAPEVKLETDPYTRQYVGFEWKPEEDHFLKEHRADMWDLLLAADFLGVPSLFDSACLFLALRMSEKDLVQEVREMFDIDMGEPKETRHTVAKRARLFNGTLHAMKEPETSTRARRTPAAAQAEGPQRRSERISSLPSKPKYRLDTNADTDKIPMRRFVPDHILHHILRFMDSECVKSCEWVCDRWAGLVRSRKQSLPREAVKVTVHADGIFAKPQIEPELWLEELGVKQKKKKRAQRKVPKEKSGAKRPISIQSLTKYGVMELNICDFGPEVCAMIEKYVAHVKEPICVQHLTVSCAFADGDEETFVEQAKLFRSLVESCSSVDKVTLPKMWRSILVAQSPELFRFTQRPPKKFTITSVECNIHDDTADFVRAISASGAKENTVRFSSAPFACFERLLELFATDDTLIPELRLELGADNSRSEEPHEDRIAKCGMRRVTANGSASGYVSHTDYELKRSEHVTFRLRLPTNRGETITFTLCDKRFKRTKKPG